MTTRSQAVETAQQGVRAPSGSLIAALLPVVVLVTVYRAAAWYWADIDLFSDETYYWGWAQALDWGYYSKPPVIAWLIAATTALFGDGELAVKSGAFLVVPLTTLLVYRIGRDSYDPQTGVAAALLFLLMPGVSMSSVIISSDVPLLCAWAAATWAYLRALRSNAWGWWLLLGLAGGVGLLSKYNMGLFAVAVGLHLALDPTQRHQWTNLRLYAATGLAASLFAPNLWWNHSHGWPTLRHTAEISQLGGSVGSVSLHPLELLHFVGGQFAVFGPVAFGALVAMLAVSGLRGPTPARSTDLALRCLIAVPLLAIATQALGARAFANWAAPAYIAASVWLAAHLVSLGARRTLATALIVNALLGIALYHHQSIARLAGVEIPRRADAFARVRGWESVGEQMSELRRQHPDAGLLGAERNLLAQLQFYASVGPTDLRSWWPPDGPVKSQFDLQMPLVSGDPRPYLFVINRRHQEAYLAHFANVDPAGQILVVPYPGLELRFAVYRVSGFMGYELTREPPVSARPGDSITARSTALPFSRRLAR